jgi:RNA polymerase sigma factor (sigma-70 family)
MPTGMTHMLRHVRHSALLGDGVGASDGELLEAFLARQEEAAFAALVRRHGPMVLGVCRRILRNCHDADDAFQAVFIVLACKAASLRCRALLGPWLYGVAYRTALKLQAKARRRYAREAQVEKMPDVPVELAPTNEELLALLDQAVQALPERYRVPVILCELQGMSRRAAAGRLRVPEGTLSSRLATARARLAQYLGQRGVTLSVSVPAPLMAATVKAGALAGSGSAVTAAVSARVAGLSEGVMKDMFLSRLKVATGVLVLALVACFGAEALLHTATAAQKTKRALAPSVSEQIALALAPAPPRPQDPKPIQCLGHTTIVVSVAVSPDGKLVASGSDDQTLRFWRSTDGKALRTLPSADPLARGGWVGALTFTPDGKVVAANTPWRGGLRFYDSGTGKPAAGRAPLPDGAYGAAFSPDGKFLAAANNRWVRVYGAAKGDKLHEFTFNRRQVGRAWRVAFSPDGKHLAAALHGFGGEEQEGALVRVWELATGKEVFAAWEGGCVNAVAFSPDGKLLAAGGGDAVGTVKVYDWVAKRQRVRFQADAHVVFCLAFSPDGKKLYTGGNDPEVKLWDSATGKAAGKLEGHTDQVADLALSKNGTVLATAGRDRRVLIWHMGARKQ